MPIPEPRIATLDEIDRAIRAEPGNGTLVNLWATWCAPCVAELPDLVRVAAEYEPDGARVLGISQDLLLPNVSDAEALTKVKLTMAQTGIRFPVFILAARDLDALNDRFALPGPIPCTIALDRHGKEVDRQEDAAGVERFGEMMRRALGRQSPAAR